MALFLDKDDSPEVRREEKPAEWYDQDYYAGNGKSAWDYEYSWQYHADNFRAWAKFLYEGFPEEKSFLDAGCAKGFLIKAMLKVAEINNWTRVIHGFDHSEYGIANAEEEAKPHIVCATTESFFFQQDYDVLISFDMLAHLNEERIRRFLLRSRPFIKDWFFGIIELDKPEQKKEVSHVTLKSREWWNKMFISCGWVFDAATQLKLQYGMEEIWDKAFAEIFIFKSGNSNI